MSAFVVSKKHIDFLLAAGLDLAQRDRTRLCWLVPAALVPEVFERGEFEGPAAQQEFEKHARYLDEGTADGVGSMLLTENIRSVNHRYADEQPEEDSLYIFARWKKIDPFTHCREELDPVAVLKAISCFEYQSMEHPEWDNSEAHAFCDALRHLAITHLPGWKDALWVID
ncbi:MAG: hypothetical protein V1755_14745 [Chloroflexota bacterium]